MERYISVGQDLCIMFDKSTDGEVTFGKDIFVTSQPGGWDFDIPGIFRCNGFPVTACDISNSPHRGNIYILWSDQRNGVNDTDIFFKKSTDGGKSFQNFKISESSFIPDESVFFGDYLNIAALDGKIYPIWMRLDQTILSVWVALSDNACFGKIISWKISI